MCLGILHTRGLVRWGRGRGTSEKLQCCDASGEVLEGGRGRRRRRRRRGHKPVCERGRVWEGRDEGRVMLEKCAGQHHAGTKAMVVDRMCFCFLKEE